MFQIYIMAAVTPSLLSTSSSTDHSPLRPYPCRPSHPFILHSRSFPPPLSLNLSLEWCLPFHWLLLCENYSRKLRSRRRTRVCCCCEHSARAWRHGQLETNKGLVPKEKPGELASEEHCVIAKESPKHVQDCTMDSELDFESHAEVFNPRNLSLARSEREDEGILLAGKYFLPPGFRFHPTDQELVLYYLKRKICGLKMELNVIAEIDLYEFEPWDLHEVSCLQTKDMQWYFFCPKVRKYPKGNRENRATSIGRWKPSGKDRPIYCGSRFVGSRKCLIYYDRRSKKEERTDWVMHEFRVTDEESNKFQAKQNNFVLCRVFKKSGRGSKRGEQYGGPMDDDDLESANEMKMDCSDSGNHVDQLIENTDNRKWHIPEISGNDDSLSESTETEVSRCRK